MAVLCSKQHAGRHSKESRDSRRIKTPSQEPKKRIKKTTSANSMQAVTKKAVMEGSNILFKSLRRQSRQGLQQAACRVAV
eukprot:982383-Pelagomonas_calceolata.AAC.1